MDTVGLPYNESPKVNNNPKKSHHKHKKSGFWRKRKKTIHTNNAQTLQTLQDTNSHLTAGDVSVKDKEDLVKQPSVMPTMDIESVVKNSDIKLISETTSVTAHVDETDVKNNGSFNKTINSLQQDTSTKSFSQPLRKIHQKANIKPSDSLLSNSAVDTTKRILISAKYPNDKRVAILQGNKLYDFYMELSNKQSLKGNIYKGIVASVLPSLQAVFVDFGHKKHGFLKFKEIMPGLYKNKSEGKKKIQNAIEKGQELIVQVDKDEHDTKGASLTTYISIPGRYIVMMPGQKKVGISRKIENREDRDRLKEIFTSLKLPKDMGFILRTACSDSLEKELSLDLKYLTKLWSNIKAQSNKIKAPALIYKDHDIALKTVRDYLTSDVAEIIVDDKTTFSAVKMYLKKIMPGRNFNVVYHKDKSPLFSLYNIDAQVAKFSDQYVNLPSKGYLVFGKTEALTAIDVNSGRSKKEGDIEDTALHTNLEAVQEIARQIRLRDIGGLIVIDFIDMQSSKNRRLIEQKMTEALDADKAHYEIAPLSKFCILEMTRERLRPAYTETVSTKCKFCNGTGVIMSDSATALSALREIHNRASTTKDLSAISCRLSLNSANILLNNMRSDLAKIEKDYKIALFILADADILPGQYKIETTKLQK